MSEWKAEKRAVNLAMNMIDPRYRSISGMIDGLWRWLGLSSLLSQDDVFIPDPDAVIPDDVVIPYSDVVIPDPNVVIPDPNVVIPDPDVRRPDPDVRRMDEPKAHGEVKRKAHRKVRHISAQEAHDKVLRLNLESAPSDRLIHMIGVENTMLVNQSIGTYSIACLSLIHI